MKNYLKFYRMPKLYWYRWILWWFQPIYLRLFRISAEGREHIPGEGPYFLIGNHSHKLDPFFIGAMIRRPIFQMASNEFFRIPLMRRFMWAMGAFPRQKGAADNLAIRYAIKLVQNGHVLAVYPEGGRNWDGKTLPILPTTARLIKLLKLPVVAAVSKGNYLAWPRWANKHRRSPITIYFRKPVTFDRDTPDEEINAWVQQSIENDDNYTKIERIRCRRPAEGLSRLLWRCPECRTLEGLVENRGKTLSCAQCGKAWEVNAHCMMREEGVDDWKAVREYALLMLREDEIVPLEHEFTDHLEKGEQLFLYSGEITLYNAPDYPNLKLSKVDDGRLLLTDRGLVFIRKNGAGSIRFTFENIRGRSTEKNFIFQIVFPVLDEEGKPIIQDTVMNKRHIKLSKLDIGRFEMLHESCLKWELYYDAVRKKAGYKAAEE